MTDKLAQILTDMRDTGLKTMADAADQIEQELANAQPYVPLAEQYRYGITGDKDGITISDNLTRQTIIIEPGMANSAALAVMQSAAAVKETPKK